MCHSLGYVLTKRGVDTEGAVLCAPKDGFCGQQPRALLPVQQLHVALQVLPTRTRAYSHAHSPHETHRGGDHANSVTMADPFSFDRTWAVHQYLSLEVMACKGICWCIAHARVLPC